MAWIFSPFKRSARELSSLTTLAVIGMLIALKIALSGLTVPIGDTLKVGVSFLASGAIGMIGGPVPGLLAGAVADVLSCVLFPKGAYIPVFTFIEAFAGMLYGWILYDLRTENKTAAVLRIIGAKLSVTVLVNLVMNTAALYHLYSVGAFMPWFATRLIKNAVAFPIECLLLILLLPPLKRLYDAQFKR